MAAKFVVVFALFFVVAVSADNSWDDWEPPAQNGIYSDGQYVEIQGRISKCVHVIGSIDGAFDFPGEDCLTHAMWRVREQPIQKEELIGQITECLAKRKSDIGVAKFNQVAACLKEELTKPLVASDDDNWD